MLIKFAIPSLFQGEGRNMKYFLLGNGGERIIVCRVMWLATFGYPNTSKYATHVLKACKPGQVMPQPSMRGKSKPTAIMVDRYV